jgi:uncharacterized protein
VGVVPAHLSVVTLGVADVAASTAFYEALGWQRLGASQDTISFVQLGQVVLGLYGREPLAEDAQLPHEGSGFRGVTLAINVGSPAAVDAMATVWVAAGARLAKPPRAAEWGGYSGYVADPDGHLWELAHNPYSPDWAAPGT